MVVRTVWIAELNGYAVRIASNVIPRVDGATRDGELKHSVIEDWPYGFVGHNREYTEHQYGSDSDFDFHSV